MTVHDLLEALLLESANDAAETLAEGVSASREAFVEEMNARAADLGLEHTSYANPIGLDEAGNYSSARDLANLARVLLRRPRFARIVDMPEADLESGARPRVVENRNDLISAYPWVSGVKTGYTANAGNVLVGSAEGPGGARVISVVLGEPTEGARNSETLALLRWGLSRFQRVRVLDPRRMVAQADIEYHDDSARLVPRRGAVITIRQGQRIRRRTNAPDEVKGPLTAGARVGTVTVLLDGSPVRRVALVTADEVPGAGTLRVLLSWLGIPLTLLLLVAIVVAAVLLLLRLPFRIRIVR
jgi:D-alanyl-D-alanine carboxypeptidase (penicillin-binding protein 5/6)